MKSLLVSAFAILPLVGLGQSLTLTNSGAAITIAANTFSYVPGSIQNPVGSTLSNAGSLRIDGDLLTPGTFTSTGGLVFSGAQDQTFAPSGVRSLALLALSNTGPAGNNRLFITGDVTVNFLLLTQGLVRTQGNAAGSPLATLNVPDAGTVSGEGSGQYVQGRLAVTRSSVNAGSGALDFTNGLVLNANGQNLGAVTVTRTAGLQTAGLSYGQNLAGTNRGIDRVWQIVTEQPLSATTPTTVTASWVSDDDNGINLSAPSQLWRADQASGPWVAQGALGSISVRSLTASVAQLGVLTVSNTSQPLPVTLVSFTVERVSNDGQLTWATASELRNDYFEVESSVDGTTFQPLGRVAGHGTSGQGYHYQYTDANLARYAAGQVYYRLRQVNTDGTSTYSPVRTVAVPLEAGLLVQAYPNPSALGTAVGLSVRTGRAGLATLRLTDILGRELSQQQVYLPTGGTTLPLPGTSQLAIGVYLLRVQQGQQQHTLKLVRE